jgi:hypothetical protein
MGECLQKHFPLRVLALDFQANNTYSTIWRTRVPEMELVMPKAKLTLTAAPEVISLAEEQAKSENTSISAMFTNFVLAKSRLKAQRPAGQKIGPLTKSLTGIVKLPDDFDEKEFMGQVLDEKYGLGK